jgi:hypothetical protein
MSARWRALGELAHTNMEEATRQLRAELARIDEEPIPAVRGDRKRRLREQLHKVYAPEAFVALARDRVATEASNARARARVAARTGELERTMPDEFAMEPLLSRLYGYDPSNVEPVTHQMVFDVMVACCLRWSELRTLRIYMVGTGEWLATGMSKMRNITDARPFMSMLPGDMASALLRKIQVGIAAGAVPFSCEEGALLAALHKRYPDIRLHDLRAFGAVLAADMEGATTDARRALIIRKALRHDLRQAPPSEAYGGWVAKKRGRPSKK